MGLKDELTARGDTQGRAVFRIGHLYASALAGFLAGVVVGAFFMIAAMMARLFIDGQ